MDPASSALLSKLIRSEIELARVFLSSSRAAYRLRNHQDGDTARQKAEAAYSRALKIAEEISEPQRQLLLTELDRLKTCLGWLPLRTPEARPPNATESIRPDGACPAKTDGQNQ